MKVFTMNFPGAASGKLGTLIIGAAIVLVCASSGCSNSGSLPTDSVTPAAVSVTPVAPTKQASPGQDTPDAPAPESSAPASETPELPGWAKSLGSNVEIDEPGIATGGSPQQVVTQVINAKNSGQPQDSCQYLEPRFQAPCQDTYQQGDGSRVTEQDFSIGYTAIEGDEALVVVTYINMCSMIDDMQSCSGTDNDDSAYQFDGGSSFDDVFKSVTGFGFVQQLIPCEKINGTWYVDRDWT